MGSQNSLTPPFSDAQVEVHTTKHWSGAAGTVMGRTVTSPKYPSTTSLATGPGPSSMLYLKERESSLTSCSVS